MADITPNACMQEVGASAMVWVDDVIDENTTTSYLEIVIEAHHC